MVQGGSCYIEQELAREETEARDQMKKMAAGLTRRLLEGTCPRGRRAGNICQMAIQASLKGWLALMPGVVAPASERARAAHASTSLCACRWQASRTLLPAGLLGRLVSSRLGSGILDVS
jgi:hypothetical protein